jgi:predicted nucleic acid-binding protein
VLVLDASAAFAIGVSVTGFDILADEELVAPALLWSEVASALREGVFRGGLHEDLALLALERLAAARIEVHGPGTLQLQAWAIARQLGWAKTYDAEYVALARQKVCLLLTVDRKLQRGAGHLVQIIGPADL